MPLPVFQPLDETAFDADRQVSAAHLKLLAENLLFCGNERQGLASLGYQQRLGPNGERRLPEWTAAQWMLRGPFGVYVPGRRASAITAGYTRPKLVIKLAFECVGGDVYALAFAGTPPVNFDAAATTIATTDTTVDLDCFGVVPGWNDVYVAIRGEALTSTESGTLSRNAVNTGFFADELFIIDSPEDGPPGPVSLTWIAIGNGADPANWRDLLTINRSSNTDDKDLVVGEIVADEPFGGSRSGGVNIDFQYGPLAYLRVLAMSADLTQGVDTDDEQRWPAFRWWNLPSSFHIGLNVAGRTVSAHAARMPQLLLGNEQVYAIGASVTTEIGGQWRFKRGGWSSKTELFRFALFNAQETLSNQLMHLEARVPLLLADVSGAEQGTAFTLTVEVYAENGSTLLQTEDGQEAFIAGSRVTEWVTARLAALAEVHDSTTARECFLDGFTHPREANAGVWAPVAATVDVSGLSLDTLYFVAISIVGETSDARTVVTIGDAAARYVYA